MDLFVKIFQMIYTFIYQNYWWINLVLVLTIIYWGRERPARSTFMWILVMTLLPIVGFFPYLLLGQDTRRTNMFRIKAEQDRFIREESEIQEKMLEDLPDIFDDFEKRATIGEVGELATLNLRLNQSVLSADNDVRVFTDGQEKFDALIKDIDQAQHSIEVQYYIFKSDGLGTRLINHLVQAAGRGVRVRLLTDGIGCRFISKREFRRMKESGIEVGIFFPSFLRIINLRMNYRNHRKLVIIDDAISYIGGFNVGDEYLGLNDRFGYWRDTHLRIQGSAAHAIKVRFIQDWYYATGLDPALEPDIRPTEGTGSILCQMVSSGPDTKMKNIKLAMIKMINQADKRIDIHTPYYIPDSSFQEALTIALQQGVEVNIMIPDKPDHPVVYPATLSFTKAIAKNGANIYRYDNGFLHSKVLIVDDVFSMVGSANIDERSFSLNFEASEIVYSAEVNQELRRAFDEDIEKSTLLTQEWWKTMPLRYKILSPICRLFAPIL